jgi:hypothetical protein
MIGGLAEKETKKLVRIHYRNHRGVTGYRIIFPRLIRYSESPWHQGAQWLLDAFDWELFEDRTFAMKDISSWSDQLTMEEIRAACQSRMAKAP